MGKFHKQKGNKDLIKMNTKDFEIEFPEITNIEIENMANEQNLISNSERTLSELQENGKKGGIKSGIIRRKKKAAKEAAILLLSLPMKGQTKSKETLLNLGIKEKDLDNQMGMLAGLYAATQKTNTSAVATKLMLEIIGEPPTSSSKVEVQGLNLEEMKEIAERLFGTPKK